MSILASREDQDQIVRYGIGRPHPLADDAYQVEFDWAEHVTVGMMLANAMAALQPGVVNPDGNSYITVHSRVFIAGKDRFPQTLGEYLLYYMLGYSS